MDQNEVEEYYHKNRIGVIVHEIHIEFSEVHQKTVNNFIDSINKTVEKNSKDIIYDWNRIQFNSYEVEGRGEDYDIHDGITIKFFRYETLEEYKTKKRKR